MLLHILVNAIRSLLLLAIGNAVFIQCLVLLENKVRVTLGDAETVAAEFKQDLLRLAGLHLDLVRFALLRS